MNPYYRTAGARLMNPLIEPIPALLKPSGKPVRVRVAAAGVVDAAGLQAVPGAVLVEISVSPTGRLQLNLIAAGKPQAVDAHPLAPRAVPIDVGQTVLIPALVNAHAHLDLTHIGPRPYDPTGGFVGWVEMVRSGRRGDPDGIAASVTRGVELSRRGAVGAVGDIAGCPTTGPTAEAALAANRLGMAGTSFLEFFGMGKHQHRGFERARSMREAASAACDARRVGLQPHATNTVARAVIGRAVECLHCPLSIHVAETPEERQFIGTGAGPHRDLLERVGVWEDSILDDLGQGLSPIEHLVQTLDTPAARARTAPITMVHVNDCSDRDLELLTGLRRSGVDVHVVYCPRASAYFGAHEAFGPHRYRDMLDRGIPVTLGTDSIINTVSHAAGAGLTPWDDMRLLHGRDGLPGRRLLEMGTIAAARAIGIDPGPYTYATPGPIAGIVAVKVAEIQDNADLIEQALIEGQTPEFLLYNNESCLAAT